MFMRFGSQLKGAVRFGVLGHLEITNGSIRWPSNALHMRIGQRLQDLALSV